MNGTGCILPAGPPQVGREVVGIYAQRWTEAVSSTWKQEVEDGSLEVGRAGGMTWVWAQGGGTEGENL